MQECFQNRFVLKSNHQDAFFNIAVLQISTTAAEKLYFITALINAEQQLL